MEYEIGKYYKYLDIIIKILKFKGGDKYEVKYIYAPSHALWEAGEIDDNCSLMPVWGHLNISEGQVYYTEYDQLIKVLKIMEDENEVKFRYLYDPDPDNNFIVGQCGRKKLNIFLSNLTLVDGEFCCSCGLPRRWVTAEDCGMYCWSCK